MRSDMREYWRDPGYWRWWWQERTNGQTKGLLAAIVAVAIGVAGFLSAERLVGTREAATFTTQRVVTVVRTAGADAPQRQNSSSQRQPEVVTRVETTTQPGETDLVTVQRAGRTVVVPAPGDTVTVRGPVVERVVPNARTETVVRTEIADRLTTVTAPGPTETVTREVTLPARTVTETNALTFTDEVTITE